MADELEKRLKGLGIVTEPIIQPLKTTIKDYIDEASGNLAAEVDKLYSESTIAGAFEREDTFLEALKKDKGDPTIYSAPIRVPISPPKSTQAYEDWKAQRKAWRRAFSPQTIVGQAAQGIQPIANPGAGESPDVELEPMKLSDFLIALHQLIDEYNVHPHTPILFRPKATYQDGWDDEGYALQTITEIQIEDDKIVLK